MDELRKEESPLQRREKIERLEAAMLKCEQADCPVIHRFGPGIYIREVTLPAGTFAIGHHQKYEHMNVMLRGRVTILNENGTTSELVAPTVFVGKPGRKVGYIHEEVVWQNIYATNETDIEKLEDTFLIKSDSWKENKRLQDDIARLQHEGDREDYKKVLTEFGFSHETARAQSENTEDQIDIPFGGYKVRLADSSIEGKGLFATATIEESEVIAPALIAGKRTFAGRYTNHSASPNAKIVLRGNGDIDLVAIRQIRGCCGGNDGEEIVIDYRQSLTIALSQAHGGSICLQ